MTFKTILVHAEPDWGSGRGLAAAVHVARRFDAHLIGLAAEAFDAGAYAYVEGALVQMLRDQIAADALSAERLFRAAVKTAGVGATWVAAVDEPVKTMASYARGADLVVTHRTPRDASASNQCRTADLVLEAGAPVLLAPDTDTPLVGRAVLVAWRDSAPARRAVIDALPFLVQAEQVVLLEGASAGDEVDRTEKLKLVCERLRRLGVAVEPKVQVTGAPFATVDIDRTAEALGADLIVAGAFSHRRFQERVLGGVTQDLIAGSSRHVFFSH